MTLVVVLIKIAIILAFCFSIGASQFVNVGGGPLIIFMMLFMAFVVDP